MYNDMDFDVAANDISEQVVVIRDPELAMTIEKWVLKLTAENRGANELKYLQLLQYMMARGRINGPFMRDPPPGPLVPLSRYVNPPPCSGRGRGSGGVECWQTSNCSRAAQTRCGDIDVEYEDEEFEEQTDNETTVNGERICDDRDVVGDLHNNDGESQAPNLEEIGRDDGVQEKRDGHLAGGGGEECRGAEKSVPKKNPFAKLCDPCLDNFGRHLLKKQPGPMDAAYKDLLGDCALPVLTDAEKKTVCPELLQILENVNDTTTLQDFYFQVSLCTCDQGALLMKLSDGMVDDFRTFVSDVFESRTEHISDGLAKEQMALCEKYAYLYDRTLNRATVALDFLREAMPVFSWHKYHAEPEEFLKRTILRRAAVVAASSGDAAAAAADGDGRPSATHAPAAAADDDMAGASGGEDDDGAQQSVIKKLLYRINWLRTEVARVDCEGQRLYEQHSELTVNLADLNRRLSDAQCRSSGDIERHKNELTVLRQRSAEQTAIIDRLMETIQLTMQDKQPSSAGC